MKVVYSRLIPVRGFLCMNFYGILFVRKSLLRIWLDLDLRIRDEIINHELIHSALARDYCKIVWIGYTIWYIVYFYHWIKELLLPPYDKAYKDIPFEREAELYDYLVDYLKYRPRFNWKYLPSVEEIMKQKYEKSIS